MKNTLRHGPTRARALLLAACTVALASCGENIPEPSTLPPSSLKLLRTFEYRNSVDDLLEGRATITAELPDDLVRANFSSISATLDCYSDVGVEQFETIALDAAAQAFATSPTPLDDFGCQPSSPDDPCVAEFLEDFGLRAFRRPLSPEERGRYAVAVANVTQIYDGDVRKGVELAVAGMLQSPYFLYRVELGEPVDEEEPDSVRKYNSFEMASRLSFALWETTPDRELLEAAEEDGLASANDLHDHIDRLLDDPRADAALARFWREHLNIDRLTLTNYPKPDATEALYADMRAEGRALANHLVTPGTDSLEFLSRDRAKLSPALAAHYGASGSGDDAALPGDRKGYLTSGVFLATHGHPDKPSPTRRGKFVLERILCRTVPPPPGDVDISIPDVPEGEATLRETLEQHREDTACSGCHQVMDPVGFSFEHYGTMGEYREVDNGLPVDASGTFEEVAFDDALGLIELIREHPDATRCVVQQAYRNALGQIETKEQGIHIDELVTQFSEEGRDYRTLVRGILTSDAFRFAHGQIGSGEGGEE